MADVRATVPRNTEAMGSIYGAAEPQGYWDQFKQGIADAFRGQAGSGLRLGNIVGEDLATGKLKPWAPFTDPLPDYYSDREGAIERANKLAGMAMTGAIPFAQKGAIGVFGGRMAVTADQGALKTAEEMAASGTSRDAIWDKTGWFQGPDSKWRFEIPDDRAGFNLNVGKTSDPKSFNHVGSVRDAFNHPELYAAYHDAGSPGLAITGKLGGYYTPNQIGISNSEFSTVTPRSTLLHELQHGIQEKEGFGRGTSINGVRQNPDFPEFTNNKIVEQLRDQLNKGDWAPATSESPNRLHGPEYRDLVKRFWTLENQAKDAMARDIYHRTAGEVEARAVQSRMNLTPEQRRARYPWLDYDVPVEQQIVK